MGDAKIGNLDCTAVSCPEEIGGFDITVNDALVVYLET